MSAMSEEIQRRQYEDLDSLLIVLREKWAFNVAINTHSSCFARSLRASQWTTSYGLPLARARHDYQSSNSASSPRLKFCPMPDVFRRSYEVAVDEIHARY
ncbi:Uncharacterized protein TCM_035350 [Theobroma cacao]|uniref:Uncharacterized protein n=1 Tax=Theobroma cacao TaxID=3641 RepID=A0A061FIP4_THECC|nr:Uncharacterized protein TCM_035350 [Theobroma cacao]